MLPITESEIKELKRSIRASEKEKSREEVLDEVFVETLSRLNEEGRLRMLYYCIVNDTFNRIKRRKPYTRDSHNKSKS